MLAYNYRFHGHRTIRRLYQQGDVVRQRSITLRYRRNTGQDHSRVTIIVAKKVAKAAVKRNRIRRRLYEVIRHHWDELNGPYDFSLTVFDTSFLVAPADEIENVVMQLLHDADMTKHP